MGRKRTPGLYNRSGVWHIDKQVRGIRLCESTGASNLTEAEAFLARRIEEVRQATVYREERLVVLNQVALAVIDGLRGTHPVYVFTYKGKPVRKMNNSAWKKARLRARLPQVRVHDLKHTFGRRLRAAGVTFEDRQDPLGHKSGRVTTHYSAAELGNLIEAANRVCGENSRKSPALVVLKRKAANE